jgi:hypothetical protein
MSESLAIWYTCCRGGRRCNLSAWISGQVLVFVNLRESCHAKVCGWAKNSLMGVSNMLARASYDIALRSGEPGSKRRVSLLSR